MTDFILEKVPLMTPTNFRLAIVMYARFLKQPLKLEMFVPCDEDGNVLEYKPNEDMHKDAGSFMAYNSAKEKVLFEGFRFSSKDNSVRLDGSNQVWITKYEYRIDFRFPNLRVKTIEDLCDYSLELTPTALKQIQP